MSHIESWREEKQSAWLYRRLAKVETSRRQAALYLNLADAAEEQAEEWARRLRAQNQPAAELDVPFRPSLRAALVAELAGLLSPRRVRPVLAAMKVRGLSGYQASLSLAEHPTMEREHSRGAGSGSGALRAAVFGVNDGLVSNTSLIMGVAGAASSLNGDGAAVMTAGVAGLLAGALSMAAGEYVSMRSQREMYELGLTQNTSKSTDFGVPCGGSPKVENA